MPTLDQAVAYICLIVFLTWIGSLASSSTRRTREPPGPKGLPILGNIFDIPTTSQWHVFNDWRRKYGEVIGLRALGNRMIVLNSRKAAETLLVERGTPYSGRPALTLMNEFIGFNWSCIFRSPGEELNRQRRVFSHCIGPASHKNYIPGITRTVHEMCLQILDTPQTFRVWTKLMVVKNLARIVYGFKIKDFDDEYVVLSEGLEKALKDLGAMGTHPIDVLPILRLLPTWIWGRKFRQDSSILRHFAAEVFRAPYNLSRGNTAKGTSHPDSMVEIMVAQNLQPDERTVKDEYSIKGAAATAYSAGAQTTTQTINSFILMMVCNPSVQAKAHDVVDRVFGGERLPELTDREREDLIYIEALLMEVYRWSSVVPLGVPHSLLNDDVYDGMLLHAGSTVISNVWGFLHDPEDYPEPMAFQPERFLEVGEGGIHSGYALRKDVPDPRSMAFGFGRRACPGRHLADSTVWLAIITLLCTFEFSKVPHPTEPGKFIEPDLEYNSAMSVSSPKPFKCVVKPRSKGTLELLRSALEGETD